jgi:DNA polymerase I-like protein with 3'-5' exonuclease and polymerase domains
VPAEKQGKKSYGKICRQLFIPRQGFVAVGTDAASLELRCLGHYMAPYDGGAFSKAVVEGKKEDGTDVHTVNMRAFGVDSRDVAKTLIYGLLYGAGEEKAGRIIGVTPREVQETKANPYLRKQWLGVEKSRAKRNAEFFEKKAREKTASNPNYGQDIVAKLQSVGYCPYPVDDYHITLCLKGRQLISNFLENTPALAELKEAVKKAHQDRGGVLKGLDGRFLHIRSEHAALNTLLQSAGAIICKQWMVEIDRLVKEKNLQDKFFQLGWIHDEVQGEIAEDSVELFLDIPDLAMRATEKFFNFKCQLNAEVQIGTSWGDTH